MRILVYSHDTFGLGNIRRMLAICEHLHASIADISILIVTGSPMLHSFRVVHGIDYMKLPCLKRNEEGDLGVRFLDLALPDIIRLRRELILTTVVSFRPDVVLVDKKPSGLAGELEPSLRFLKCNLPETRILLVLRDILDTPRSTIEAWNRQGSYNTIQWYYDDVLVLGMPQIFDVRKEYGFPDDLRAKVRFCGYVSREAPARQRADLRRQLLATHHEHLVVITAGGGEDGYQLLATYLDAMKGNAAGPGVKSLIITGPELSAARTRALEEAASGSPDLQVLRFTDDMMSYLNAADVVVSMGGYNTVCELLTLRKRAIVVPRVAPVEEQKIRAERMAQRHLFRTIMPDSLTPQILGEAVAEEIQAVRAGQEVCSQIDLGALPRIARLLSQAVRRPGEFAVGRKMATAFGPYGAVTA